MLFTKTESGGRFWRLLVNRMLFAVMLSNAVIALVVGAQGIGSINSVRNGNMLYAMIPLPFLIAAFKWYIKRAFDDKLLYYATEPFSDSEGHGNDPKKRNDRVAVKFGNPALYKRLITPMVHAKSQHLLKEIYGHRSNADRNIFDAPHRRSTDRATPQTPLGYSDMYMSEMDPGNTGRATTQDLPQVEIVAEQDLDFENFKKRAEFREEFGGDGELYGRPEDLVSRPGTPSTFATMTDLGLYSKGGSNGSTRNSSKTKLEDDRPSGQHMDDEGTSYGQGYQHTPRTDTFDHADRFDRTDGFESVDVSIPATPFDPVEVIDIATRRSGETGYGLLGGRSSDAGGYVDSMRDADTSYDRFRQK